ncbi:MAG: hypothetical protein IT374_09065 [Polyangiaceae bacterium]|nr:hypothetical protein [Polyangiaceae bacterium]
MVRSVLSAEDAAWIAHDDALRARAAVLAAKTGRDADDLYRTLKNLERTPGERLALGLRHARLHPKFR